jgi:hypothetical protein
LSTWQSVTMGFDPYLRYLTGLPAKMQRRATSGFIEKAFDEVEMHKYDDSPDIFTLSYKSRNLSEVGEVDRIVKWALYYSKLLTCEEQVIWGIVRDNKIFWLNGEIPAEGSSSYILNNRLSFLTVKKHWVDINLIACGEKEANSLPIEDVEEASI